MAATFDVNSVTIREGCAVYLDWNGDHFSGSTRNAECTSTLRGASYATSQVKLYETRMESWDQGFDANDIQVWGATDGAYIFVRRPEEMAPSPPLEGGGETCEDALDFEDSSQDMNEEDSEYAHVIDGRFGARNDYNPLDTSGLAPGCSVVYDAIGRDVVYAVDMTPGDRILFRLSMPPGSAGGLYFMDSCENGTWPDTDMSGACGRDEYRSHGNCDFNDCRSLLWEFEWPLAIDGQPTEAKTLFLVIDEVRTANAEEFRLEWTRVSLD
jgi:hypothetical protein